jgi:hypothetical protein
MSSESVLNRTAAAQARADGAAHPAHTSPPAVFQPFIPASATLRELTLPSVIIGTLLGVIFGASSLYLVLKVGLTLSASIPVAVISITLFRAWSKLGFRDATILEKNIVQTAGSAGESIAFGIGVTMPAILILGFDLDLTRVILVSVLGGLLGIQMMIPMRTTSCTRRPPSSDRRGGTSSTIRAPPFISWILASTASTPTYLGADRASPSSARRKPP